MVRTALVGGGGSGIGRASAECLVDAGLDVVLYGRTEDSLAEAVKEIGAATGGNVDYLVADVAVASSGRIVEEVERRFAPIDVLVANAGGPKPGRIMDVDDAGWHTGLELLLLGPLRLARAVMPRMAERGFGRVIFTTSTAVRKPEPDLAVSVVVRSALTAAAKLLSLEYAAYGVTVNCVAPGATDTARRDEILSRRAESLGLTLQDLQDGEAAHIPAGRAGSPKEIGAAIAFLASGPAAYVNGTALSVDGGRTEAIW
jgi:3-oxoacyl-[acyl-carrier protein] reductase